MRREIVIFSLLALLLAIPYALELALWIPATNHHKKYSPLSFSICHKLGGCIERGIKSENLLFCGFFPTRPCIRLVIDGQYFTDFNADIMMAIRRMCKSIHDAPEAYVEYYAHQMGWMEYKSSDFRRALLDYAHCNKNGTSAFKYDAEGPESIRNNLVVLTFVYNKI